MRGTGMNFGTIPDSHLTVDLAGFAWSAAYLVPLAVVLGIVVSVAVHCRIGRRRARARTGL